MSQFNHGNVFRIGDFDDTAERELPLELIKQIQKQRVLRDGRIDLYINSFGGYGHLVYELIEIVELAKQDDVMVRTMVMDSAFSAGSMLAITGSEGERYISEKGHHLIHYGNIGSVETTPLQIERWTNWKKADFQSTIAHYEKYADVPDIRKHVEDDGFFVAARNCIKWGLADKYLKKLDIGYDDND